MAERLQSNEPTKATDIRQRHKWHSNYVPAQERACRHVGKSKCEYAVLKLLSKQQSWSIATDTTTWICKILSRPILYNVGLFNFMPAPR